MRIKLHKTTDGRITGYSLWLSARDTYDWANRTGASWPCSECEDHRLFVGVDTNGLCEFSLDGRDADMDGTELGAIVSDHLPLSARHLWPTWEIKAPAVVQAVVDGLARDIGAKEK